MKEPSREEEEEQKKGTRKGVAAERTQLEEEKKEKARGEGDINPYNILLFVLYILLCLYSISSFFSFTLPYTIQMI